MDFSGFEIGGVSLLLLVPGVVEFCKSAFGVKDRLAEALTVGLGCAFIGLAQAIALEFVPALALPWIIVAVVGPGGGLAIAGFIDRVVDRAAQAARSMPRLHK